MRRVREECGDVGAFQLADRTVILLSGAEANEFFFRSTDEDLDQQAAYPFMKPIFGEGVVFDASPERRKEMLHNSALRGEQMRGHAATIGREVEAMVAQWGDEGEIDLLDFFAELTIYTSSACLIGKKFRDELDDSFAKLYHELEQGTDALAFVDPYAPIESFRRRDEARLALVALVQDIMNRRIANPPQGKDDRDMLDVLVSVKDENGDLRFSADEITGIFISMMFAGHHTTSGTAAWSLIEMLRQSRHHDGRRRRTRQSVLRRRRHQFSCPAPDSGSGGCGQGNPSTASAVDHPVAGGTWRFRSGRLRDPRGPSCRRDTRDLQSNRRGTFPRPDTFDPGRYIDPNQEDIVNRWTWIPFGAGRHRCVGAAFAQMQLKAIFSILLRDFEFEMAQPSQSYRNDHSKMVVQLQQPCAVRYRRRTRPGREG